VKKLKVVNKEVLLAWNCIAVLITAEMVTEGEAESLISLMDSLGNQHRKSTKPYNLKLTVDEFKSIWHSINMCLEKELIPEKKQSPCWTLIAKVAELLDIDTSFNTEPITLLESMDEPR
jgi:hypothetical protein